MSALSLPDHLLAQLGEKRQLCVAFSGGLDSTVLLHALLQLRASRLPDLQLRAIHVNHGLSAFAHSWTAHCQALCQHWQVSFLPLTVSVDASQGGIEAAARSARYQALAAQLLAGETLLTAQHLNDQCETFMLALKRGSGPAGLSAMAASTQLAGHSWLRPLLSLSRPQLEAYALQHQLQWIDDDSNQDARFDRNFLRLEVLPLLYQRWPHFAAATARSAELCAEQEALLDELLQESLAALTDQQNSLSIDGLQGLSAPRRSALLRRWLANCGAQMPSRQQLQRLWDEVALSRDDAEPRLQLGAFSVRRFRQRLYWLPPMQALGERVIAWSGVEPLSLPDGLGSLRFVTSSAEGLQLRQPRADETVTVRFHASGDVHKVGRDRRRPIKKLWQELNIPPWQRDRIPLIFYNQQLIAAAGLFITREALSSDGQEAIWWLQWSNKNN